MNLANRHCDYEKTAGDRCKSRDLYEGNSVVKAKGELYLFKEKNEEQCHYDLRLKRAVLDPYVEKIVEARQAILFRRAATRKLSAGLDAFLLDVDMKGTSAEVFFKDCAREAQIDGVHWVLVDKPRLPEGAEPPASKLAETAAGIRPFFQHVPANSVIDWSPGDDQKLDWVVVEQCSTPKGRAPGEHAENVTQWKVWTRFSWEVFELGNGKDASAAEFVSKGGGTHGLGAVPLVPFLGIPHTEYSGWPVAEMVLDNIILKYNKDSDLDWFERLASHPIPYVIAPNKPEKLDGNMGLWIKSDAGGGNVACAYLETTGAPFDSLRTSIETIHRKILSLALAQAQKETKQVQSGDSQREDRKIFTSSLESASRLYESAEVRCWDLMSKWAGDKASGAVKVEYNREFDDKMIEAQMVTALEALCDARRLSTRTLLQTLKQAGLLPETLDIDAELASASKENAQASADVLRVMQDLK